MYTSLTHMLWKKHNYLNKNIPYIVSNEIIEYDIKSAGYNIMKKFKILDEARLEHLDTLNKKQKQIQIGLYIRSDRELGRKLNEKFIEVRQWFFENNDLEEDNVLSIKKDAIITTKRCLINQFDNIEFVEKNLYTSYYNLNNYEFYYNKDTVDIKGISDEKLELHRDYMLDFLYDFFKMMEISNRKKVIKFIQEFSSYYKDKKLDIGYYRELNVQSLFRLNEYLFKEQIGIKFTGDKKKIDIGYNFMNYVLPLISILV